MCFFGIFFFFFDIALRINQTLNALKNLTAIVAIIGLQTNSSMPTHPDWNGTLVTYSTLVVFYLHTLNIKDWWHHSRVRVTIQI